MSSPTRTHRTETVETDLGSLSITGEDLKPLDRERAENVVEDLMTPDALGHGITRMRSRRVTLLVIVPFWITLVEGRGLDWTFGRTARGGFGIGGGRFGIAIRPAR